MCVWSMCMWAQVPSEEDPQNLEIEVAMSHLTRVLGTELGNICSSSILVLNTQPVHFVPCMPSCDAMLLETPQLRYDYYIIWIVGFSLYSFLLL